MDIGRVARGSSIFLRATNNTNWKHLHTLDLSGNGIVVEGAIELSKNTTWINLQALNLGENKITPQGLELLK